MKKGIYLVIDEFNTIILANLLAWKLKTINPQLNLTTVCHRDYEVLFSYFDNKLFFESKSLEQSPVDYLAGNTEARSEMSRSARNLLQVSKIDVLEFQDVCHLVQKFPDEPIHAMVLSNSVEYILKHGAMVFASTSDHSSVEAYLRANRISGKPVVVIGRNRNVHPQYNNLMRLQIFINLLLGRQVINATFPNPNLKFSLFPNYYELPSEFSSYGFSVALMETSRETVLLGNAGGVGTHMMTTAPLRIVGLMNWVNGQEFSFDGLTLFEARRISGLITRHTWVGENVKNVLGEIKRRLNSRIKSGG